MILEGILTTLNDDGTPHIAPMGPAVDHEMRGLVLRPFLDSRSFANLKRSREGVFHVTDDVEMIARAAVHRLESTPRTESAAAVKGVVLLDACRWYALRVTRLEEVEARAQVECEVVDSGRFRDFFGFNRAKHAVLEAAVLATRIEILPAQQILDDYQRLRVIVDKTAGEQEQRAFAFLEQFLARKRGQDSFPE
ncbi:MAG: DUF447 domain-containing protein [Pirellulaceae bacterium]